MYYLGIDFGTSYTKAAVYDTSKPDSYYAVKLANVGIQNDDGRIPTVAFFDEKGGTPIIGNEAINSRKKPSGTFFSNFKPELDSLSYGDSNRQNKLSSIVVEFLKHIKKCAEEQIKREFNADQKFKEVVLTVPASAPKDGIRYRIMREAAKKAGFEDVLIIPEPVAAAYCLLKDNIHSAKFDDSLYLICDFGGGTFDTSIIRILEQQIQVVDESVGSDNEQKWGGIYIDSLVGADYIKRGRRAQHLVSIIEDKALSREDRLNASDELSKASIRFKETLSERESCSDDFQYSLSRSEFESIIKEMVDNTIQCTRSLIDSAHEEKLCEDIKSVKTVFLVGGTSQIPFVYKRWQHQRDEVNKASFDIERIKELNVVAKGASRYRDLKLSPSQLNDKGKEKALNGDFMKAAAFFNNAGDKESVYWLGVLYYMGVIGRKRQPAKAYKLFEQAISIDDAKLMMALMRFNGDGVIKNDEQVKLLLKKLPDSELDDSKKLRLALESVVSGKGNENDLNTIYQFDPKSLFAVKRKVSTENIEEDANESPADYDPVMVKYKTFSSLVHFGQGFALVQNAETKCWHFLDKEGRLSKEGYQEAHLFSSDGFAAVKKNGLWGFIDREFRCRTGFVYRRVGGFSEGLAYFELDNPDGVFKVKRGFLNTSFNVELDLTKNYSGYGLKFGNLFSCGLFTIWSDYHMEWINHSGEIVDHVRFNKSRCPNGVYVGDVINGVAKVTIRGYWATSANYQSDYDMYYMIQEHRYIYYSNEGFICRAKITGSRTEEDYDGTLFSIYEYSDYGYVDKYGNDVSEYKYKKANAFSEHFAGVSLDGRKYGFINNQFEPICDFIYDNVGYFSEGKAAIKQDDLWGFINKEGEVVVPCEYEYVEHFSEGLAAVRKDRKWGFVNTFGNLVIPCIYDEVEHFSEGFCIVSSEKIRFFVDKRGKVLQLINDTP